LLTVYLRQRSLRDSVVLPWRFLLAGVVISGTALAISLTRSAWIAVALAAPLAFISSERSLSSRTRRLLVLLVIVLPISLALLLGAMRLFPSADLAARLSSFGRLASDPHWQVRLTDARIAYHDWLTHPLLGNGTGSFAQLHGARAGTPSWISNQFLHTLVDTGVVGLLIQLALLFLILRDAWRSGQRSYAPQLQVGLPAMAAGLLTMLICYQATDGTWLALFWIHLGVMANGIFVADRTRESAPPRSANADAPP